MSTPPCGRWRNTTSAPNFHGLVQVPRKFVADDDPGMQMISWPGGKRPPKVIRYGDEVMTGFEYSAAAAMIQPGLLPEGLAVAHAVGVRYDGRLRTKLTPGDSRPGATAAIRSATTSAASSTPGR